MIFSHKYIDTRNHWMVGTIWAFRGCNVKMQDEGFECDCQKKPKLKCKHIKSVEMSIFGVGIKDYKL